MILLITLAMTTALMVASGLGWHPTGLGLPDPASLFLVPEGPGALTESLNSRLA